MIDTWIAAVMVGEKIVVIGCIVTAPDASVTMRTLSMDRIPQTLGDNVPGECKVFHPIEGSALVGAPTDRAVVYNNVAVLVISVIHYLHRVILCLGFVAHSAADEADNYIARGNPESIILKANSVSGSSLARNRTIGLIDLKLTLQSDDPGDIEDNYPGIILGTCPAVAYIPPPSAPGKALGEPSSSTDGIMKSP